LALDRQKFDAVLMDVQMPEMDGFEATAAIREREKTSGGHLPIVAMTAHAMKGDRERCLAAGMDGYISKPIRSRDLFDTLHETLSGHETAPLNSATAANLPVPEESLVDWSVALQRVEGDRELLREIAEVFLDESAKLLADIRQALDSADAPRLRRAAHTLKGSMVHFVSSEVCEPALRLENMGREDRLAGADGVFQDLTQTMDRLSRALVTFQQEFCRPAGELLSTPAAGAKIAATKEG
jgi:CheY-like chemotaxis protein